MELDEIKQYSHKIKKIHITNDNYISEQRTVTMKITLDDVKDNEIIRFSEQKYSNWFVHQSQDNDYFLEIPNKINNTITIYAHYFPISLYDYLEEQQIFSIYDWSELIEEIPISQYHNESYDIIDGETIIDENRMLSDNNKLHINNDIYTITYNGTTIGDTTYYIRNNKLIINGYTYNKIINKNGYEHTLDENDNLIVHSTLTNSINGFKDPNYKNYTKLVNDNNISNSTEKGYFPLSSRYRGYIYTDAPNINVNPSPYWINNNQISLLDCNRQNQLPYWEAKIHKNGLSPLIADTQDDEYYPINVYLNYQYLPSSTEYHQHYFGFEPAIATNKTFTILNGENLTTINKQFGQESTYRIINNGNPFDDTHAITINHNHTIPVNLKDATPNKDNNGNNTCEWTYNSCYGYYIYTPNGEGHVAINVELEENEPYQLQYFIYIPSDSTVENDSCIVYIEHRDENDNISIDELKQDVKDILLKQDKILRDQWIYHEISFKAKQNNRIIIKGAQHKNSKDKVFFTHFKLVKMNEYSPTLKYNDTGLYITEQDQWTVKSVSEQYDECVDTKLTDVPLWEQHNTLPTPIKDIKIIFNDDFDILYDEITSELSWISGLQNCIFKFSPYDEYIDNNGQLQWQTNDNEISLMYDKINNTIVNNNTDNANTSTGQFTLYRKQVKVFTTGANNSFTLILQNSEGERVTEGQIQCDIVKTVADTNPDTKIMALGTVEPDSNGQVSYTNLNFKNLHPDNTTYFLRIIYTHPCIDKNIIDFKTLVFESEYRNMNAYMLIDNESILCASSEYNNSYILHQTNATDRSIKTVEQLPLRIDTHIYNQMNTPITEGYCELSIDDELIQSTIIDANGVADFYIDFNDIYGAVNGNYNDITHQTIKIEYFNKYYESINYIYFDIIYDFDDGYDARPAIPIHLYSISDDSLMNLNTPTYQMNSHDDVFILNIDTEGLSNFSITIETDSGDIQKTNILNPDDIFILIGEYNNKTTDTYTITTDNIQPNDKTGLYRKNKRSFTVIWN